MKRTAGIVIASIVAIALVWVAQAPAQTFSKDQEMATLPNPETNRGVHRLANPRAGARASQLFGTIIYDTGIASSFSTASSSCVGNQFDTALTTGGGGPSPVNDPGTVTKMSFYLVGLGGTNAFISVFGPVNGTTASVLSSVSVPGLALGFNSHTFATPIAYNTSFLAGVWNLNGSTGTTPTNDAVGLDSNTVGGQGHHGMVINDIAGTGFQTIQSQNAIVGVTGDVLIPVELLEFTVSDG